MAPAPLHRIGFLLLVALLASTIPAAAGTFKNPPLINTAFDPIGVATADLNRDGKLDLLYIDGPSPVLHVLLGNGDETFRHSQDLALPAGTCGYAICFINLADVTNDGNLDVILGGGIQNVEGPSTALLVVLPGNGDGTFNAPIISTFQNLPPLNGQMAIGDLNGDGAMDIVAVSGYSLDVFLGDNSGIFTLTSSQALYFGGQTTLYLHDLNGDGHLDIVANDLIGARTFVLLGNGDGTFQSFVTYNLSYAWLFVDMDGDGHPDLVGAQYGQGVVVSKGNPDGTFAAPLTIASPPNANLATVADYNGDGIPDLVFITPFGVAVAPSQGYLSYGSPISSVAGTVAEPFLPLAEFAPGDFNNDGHNDLAIGVDGGILILQGNGTGGFASADYYEVGHSVGATAVADFSGDGIPDIAVTVAATYPRLLLGTGSGTFTPAPDQNQTYTSQTPADSLVTADFNGDGKPDLESTQAETGAFPNGQTLVWFNAGNDTFSAPLTISAGPALAADINNDGRSDLLYVGDYGAITVMLGQTNSTFTTVTTKQWQGGYPAAAIGDVNNDGKPDLLLYEGQALRLWLGNGDGTFSPSNLVTIPNQGTDGVFWGQQVAIADIDGDGKADIIIAPTTNAYRYIGPLMILYGNGDGTFQSPQLIAVSHAYTQFVVADINRDNKPDLVLTDGSGIAVITNLGNRTFSAEDHYVAGQGIIQLNVVDLNGDGFPDIVAANSTGTTVTVLLNQPTGKPLEGAASAGIFTVAPAPSNYSQPVTLKVVMSASGGSATPSGSVTFYVDGSYITDVSLVSGSASYVYTTALVTGTHTFVATYNGDNTYGAASFAVLQTVNPPVYPTATALSAVPTAVLTSQTVRLTATVTSAVTVPAGWVTFLDGTNSLGAKQVDAAGVALLDTATLTAGTHQISATYQGYQDPWNLHSIYQPSTSSAVTVTVNAIPTSTTISASTSSPTAGTVVTFAAAVTTGSTLPFGGVSFYDGSVLLGTTSLAAGATASFSTASLSTGSHSITAVFNATATFATSTSPVLNIAVAAASAKLVNSLAVMNLQNSQNGKSALQAEVVTASTSVTTGAVTFLDEGSILGRAIPDGSGAAVLLTPSLRSGVHNLSASFSGNSPFAPAVSPEFVEQWPPSGSGFSMELSGTSMSISATDSEQLLIGITPIGSFRQPVQFACGAGVPSGYRCVFSPSSLEGGGTSYLTLQPAPKSVGRRWLFGAALGFLALFVTRRQGRRPGCVLALLVSVSLIMAGCGRPPAHLDRAQLQVLCIRASSGSGSSLIIHSAQVIIKTLPEHP